jgi:ABC-2 type transport system ATP-binding protein
MNWAIEATDLRKSHGKTEALRGLDLKVPRGSLCGFIGANGAGKTTTIRILLNIARADGGSAKVLGLDTADAAASLEIRRRIAYLPETKKLFPVMTVSDFLRFIRPFYPKWSASEERRLLEKLGIPLAQKLCHLSKGTLGKLHFLTAICHEAELIVLDEPTDGLDAIASQTVLEELARLVAVQGTTVLYCSHRLEEIEQLADHLIILHEGRALLSENMDELRAQARRIDAVFSSPPDNLESWGRFGILTRDERLASLLTWRDPAAAEAFARGLGAVSVASTPVTLRQLFVDMIRGQHALA